MSQNAQTKIQVTGGGSGTGFAALQNKTTDLANASRKIKPAEITACVKTFGKRPTEYKVALDGLSVYVNESNSIKELSLEQLEGIFTGRIRNWKDVGGNDAPIVVVAEAPGLGTRTNVEASFLGGEPITANARTMQALVQVIQVAAQMPNAISYGNSASITGNVAVILNVEVEQRLGLATKGAPSADAQKLTASVAKYGAGMK